MSVPCIGSRAQPGETNSAISSIHSSTCRLRSLTRGKDALPALEGKWMGRDLLSVNKIPVRVFRTHTSVHNSGRLSSFFEEQKQEKGNFQRFSFCQT